MSQIINMKYTDEIRAIDDQISDLKRKRYDLEQQEITDFQERAKVNIGRCFKDSHGYYYRIIDVPQRECSLDMHWHFNPYQYPVICLTDDSVPFEEDTIFPFPERDSCIEEIDSSEFEAEFDKRIQEFRKCILGGK